MANDDDPDTLATGTLKRTRKLLGLAAKLGRTEATRAIRAAVRGQDTVRELKARVDQAKAFVQTVGQLKGAAMKAGQLLSIEASDFFPPEVSEVLSKLQDKGSTMSIARVEEILRAEWGAELMSEVQDLSPEPVGSASIGQVHRARFRGRDVAIKVQFPGVAESIDSDLSLLRKIAKGALAITHRSVNIDELFAELAKVLKLEVDYVHEAQCLQRYRANFASRADDYRIPELVPELSTARVLAMSYEPGLKVRDWLQTSPDQATRRHFGKLVLDLYSLEFFEMGLVQTDPNFANFFFPMPGSGAPRRLTLLDFGATREYAVEFRENYRRLLWLVRYQGQSEVMEQIYKMRMLSPRESEECQSAFVEMLRVSLRPFEPQRQPFDFASADYSKAVMESTVTFRDLVRYSAPPHEILFLHRKLGGIFSLLKTLRVEIDLTQYWRELVDKGA